MFKGKTALVTGSTSGIGLGIATELAGRGANIVLNGFGDAAEIEKLRTKLAADHGVKVRYDGADLSQQDAIESMMGNAIEMFGGDRHPDQQRRHPVRRADRRVSGRQVERDHRAQPDRLVSHDPAGAAEDEGQEVGSNRQHRVGARARREPVQVRVRRREARDRGLTKTVALEVATQGITMNAVCPGYVWTPLVEKQIPDTAKARGLTEDQVINDVLLHAQPTKKFVQVSEVAALTAFLASDEAASITGAIIPIDGGWTAQ